MKYLFARVIEIVISGVTVVEWRGEGEDRAAGSQHLPHLVPAVEPVQVGAHQAQCNMV